MSGQGAHLALDVPLRAEPAAAPVDDEAALVERVRAGDGAAFETLVNRYMRRAF